MRYTVAFGGVKTRERRTATRTLREVREALGLGVREFAGEAGVSTRTLQDTERGKPARPQTAMKYAEALRRRGADPNEVREIRDALGGEVFFVNPDPDVVLLIHAMRSWKELTRGLVRAGHAEELGERLRTIAEEHGEEATQVKEARDRVDREIVAEETARESEAER